MNPDKKTKEQAIKEYGAESIKVLEGLEAVRKRPAMYIGSTGKDGLHHCVYEVVDNAIDEAQAGYASEIKIIIDKDGSLSVEDNGRGIPIEKHVTGKSAMEVALTKLHAGGKFDKKAYQISGGLHGVGVSVVNALSKKMVAQVRRNGKVYEQVYKNGGHPEGNVKEVGKSEETGTTITFWPDPEIFITTTKFDYDVLIARFRELSFLNPGLKITLKDEREDKKTEFYSTEGLMEFIKWLNRSKNALHKPVYFKKEFDHSIVEVAIQYNEGYNEGIFGFVNTINTVEGGTHVSGFKTALTRAINDYANSNKMLKNFAITGDDVREGLTAIISLKIPDPQFEGQTKTKLGNSEIKGFVDSITSKALQEFFEQNPPIAKRIAQKCVAAAEAREAARKARELVRRKTAMSISGLPGKLADCSSNKLDETELFIVEGESAGGCFSGDTQVALADGRNISFKDLVNENEQGKENFCYTIKENGSIGIEKIENPRITKKDAEVIKITLSNNEEIICTLNHKFMLRDGSYKEANKLEKTDSLMPFNRRISKIGGRITIEGYEMVWDQFKTWVFTHMLADEYNLENEIYAKEQGEAKHHINFNKLNNNPTNIIRMPKEEHLILHTQHLDKTLHNQESKEKARIAHQNPEYRKVVSEWAKQPEVNEMLSQRAKEQWENEEYKQFMVQKFKEFYESNAEYRNKNNAMLNEQQRKYWQNPENRAKAAEKVKQFFEENPEAKEYLSNLAKEQWNDETLIMWRRQKTKEQWTPGFREQRYISYNKTYYDKTIKLMKISLEKFGSLDNFDKTRIENNDKSILSIKTFCSRFFNNNSDKMIEAIKNWNHKIKKIEFLTEKIDVYDIEVPKTHNFALASGIFVHNSAKQARDKEFQAILPLKGKILNVEKAAPTKVFSSEEIANLLTAIGTGTGEQFVIDKLRYGKIIIMTDADVDGQHIKTLLLTLFFRYVPRLIEAGRVFVAVAPLYKIKRGNESHYVYSDDELKRKIEKLGGKPDVQRFKGLGEMNPQQLWETTMNPKDRALKQIEIEDAVEADEVFSMLMGDEVGPRRQFIEEHAKYAELDI
jgi:DNA gyrase subunit B